MLQTIQVTTWEAAAVAAGGGAAEEAGARRGCVASFAILFPSAGRTESEIDK